MKVRLAVLREYISELSEHYDSLLVEGRVEDAREKYPDISDEDFEFLLANQPAGSNNKYLMWSCAQVDEGFATEVTMQAVRLFDGNKQRLQKKDLYQYKEPGEVEEAIEKLGGPSKNKQAQQAKADTDVIYNDDQFMVVRPHTTEASCKYGAGTTWCIAATQSRNYFSSYSQSNNKFYFIIDKKQTNAMVPSSKFAIVILDVGGPDERVQVFNSRDQQVGLKPARDHLGEKWNDVWTKIKQHVAANPITREVEEQRKATEEHVKTLLKGEKVSREGLEKIAKDGRLTAAVVKALLKTMKAYNGQAEHDPRPSIISNLSVRASELPPETCLELIQYVQSTKPPNSSYWYGYYNLERLINNAPLRPEDFRSLAETGGDEILKQVLKNPNAPPDLLATAAARVSEFRDRDLKTTIYKQLIKTGTITAEQFREAVKPDYYVNYDIFHHPEFTANIPPEFLKMVPISTGEELKKMLQLPHLLPMHAAELLSKYWNKLAKYDLYDILKTTNLPEEAIEKLWGETDQHMRVSLLQNPAVGATNASKFARSKNSAYRFAVAHNTITPPEDLATLAADVSVSTRSAVAANPNTPPETLKQLATDSANAVRASVASNGKTPLNVLQALKRDGDDFVRKAVRKTLKTLETTESAIRFMLSMQSLITEDLNDDSDTPDIMKPSWRDLRNREVEIEEFVAVFLLQNNGHATREEIEEAFLSWRGGPVGDLWNVGKYNNQILRGATAGGKGWYWAPPGINKGALFRLTPAGASAAMAVLNRYNMRGPNKVEVNAMQAIPGTTYYVPRDTVASDVTGMERGELKQQTVEANRDGTPRRDYNNQFMVVNPYRGRRRRGRRGGYYGGSYTTKIFKYTSPSGESRQLASLPQVRVTGQTPVQFVKVFHGSGDHGNKAIVRNGERFLMIDFPLFRSARGEETEVPREKARVHTAPPPPELAPKGTARPAAGGEQPVAAAASGAPRGPKTTYKIYGKFKGHPVATRLKGQAYVGGNDTEFRAGEQAIITTTDDGKLTVKKTDSDHTQTWEPVDG